MTATASPSNLSIALAHARKGRPVAPGCPPDDQGACTCGGKWDDTLHQLVPHAAKEVGKAPIGRLVPHGITDATTNTATIDRWWRTCPDANVNLELQVSGLVVVDTDAVQVEADALSRGLDGAAIRESRNRAYVFKRSADCPVVNLIKAEGDPLDVLTRGNFVVWGTHQTGCPVQLDPDAELAEEPAWVRELLERKQAEDRARLDQAAARSAERARLYGDGREPPVRLHQRGQRRWHGELVATNQAGKLDRDLSLFYLGLDLAECGASEGAIIAALEERDAALTWCKFTGRSDAEKRYTEIAEKAVARAIEQEQDRSGPSRPAPAADAGRGELRAALEAAEAEIRRLQRRALDQDDRLEVLEPIVTAIDEIIARPETTIGPDGAKVKNGPTSDDKLVAIAVARWMPHYRNRRQATGQPATIALGYLAKVMGMPKRRISDSLRRQSSRDPNAGAPWHAKLTRELKFDDDGVPVFNPKTGKQRWESSLEVIPWGNTPTMLRAAATIALPELPRHGGSTQASDVRWGRCRKHDNRTVRIKGYCPDCGQVVGERIVSLSEFDALNVQVGHSETPDATVSPVNSITVQVGHSEHASRPPACLNVQVVDSDAAPPSLLEWPEELPPISPPELAGTDRICETHGIPRLKNGDCSMCERPPLPPIVPRPRSAAWRCPVLLPDGRTCGAMDVSPLPDGSVTCSGRRHPVAP